MKKILVLLLLVAVSMPLIATGQKEQGSTKTGPVTIKVISTYNKASIDTDARVAAWFNMQEEIKKAHPDVQFEFEYIPHDAYQDKIQILAAANELPDLFELKGSWTKNFVSNDRVLPLNELFNSDSAWKNSFKKDVFRNFTLDKKIYAVNVQGGGSTHVIFYNKDILKKAGYTSVPRTYDDFKVMIKAIASAGYTPISLGDKSSWVAESCYLSTIGNRMTGVEWTDSITNRSGASFNNPQFIKALGVMQELAKIGAFNPDMNSLEYTQQRTSYYNGKAAMFVEGGWAVNHVIKEARPEVRAATDMTDFPKIKGQIGPDNLNTGGTSGWGIAANAGIAKQPEKKALAFEIMKTFVSMKNAVKLAEQGRIPSMKVKNYDTSKLKRLNKEYLKYMDRFIPAPTYDLVWNPAVIETLNSGLQMLLIGKVSPKELAANVQKSYERAAK